MTKFKIGDKVRILDVKSIWFGDNIEIINGVATVEEVNSSGRPRLKCVSGMPLIISAREMRYIEKLPQTPTKNQRLTDAERTITALESEVAELKAKVEALEKAQSPTKPVTQNITVKSDADISKVASQLAKLIEGETDKRRKKSPNEKRKAIIAEAKAFVAENLAKNHPDAAEGGVWFVAESGGITVTDEAEFIVNEKKRTVVALIKDYGKSNVYTKAVAKCAPDDVFNADIGKAIALGRALGLDVSRFEQAVKPDRYRKGMLVRTPGGKLYKLTMDHDFDVTKRNEPILDDTEAVY